MWVLGDGSRATRDLTAGFDHAASRGEVEVVGRLTVDPTRRGALRGASVQVAAAAVDAVYLLVGSELTGIAPERGQAEYHFATRKGAFERRSFTGADLRGRRGDLDKLLAGIANGVRSGVFHMAPATDKSCDWCDFDGLCPANRTAEIDRKSGDPLALAHSELTGIE